MRLKGVAQHTTARMLPSPSPAAVRRDRKPPRLDPRRLTGPLSHACRRTNSRTAGQIAHPRLQKALLRRGITLTAARKVEPDSSQPHVAQLPAKSDELGALLGTEQPVAANHDPPPGPSQGGEQPPPERSRGERSNRFQWCSISGLHSIAHRIDIRSECGSACST